MRNSHHAPDTVERPRYWADDAACRGYEPADTFHPQGYTGADLFTVAAAKAVCRQCPVVGDCLSHALDHGERDGIWGGLTPDERREAMAQRRTREGPRAAA
jgi:WhiB family redox-sensing transcriptional regulator